VRIALTAGPDAGRYVELAAGAHLLGRAPVCALRVDDAAVEAHHILVDVGGDGAVEVTQLAGRAPVIVDGECADGRTAVRRVVEVGDSRLELKSQPAETDPPPAAPLVLAECPDPVAALSEAAGVRRRLHVHRAAGPGVSLGVGTVRLPIELVDVTGGFAVELHALLTRAEWHEGLPVLVDVEGRSVIGLVDDHPGQPRARAVARSIAHQTRSGHQTAPGCQRIGDQNGVELVIAAPGEPVLERCTALLEIGARWRARWTPDLDRPDEFVRLHAAGRAAQPGCSSPSR
jgi:hypothetical protein